MMDGMGEMGGTGLVWVPLVVALALAALAFVKYLSS